MFFENSTAALILVKRESNVASLRIAAVVLGGFAPTSPHDDANKTGSVGRGVEKTSTFQLFLFISFHFQKSDKEKKKKTREREERKGKEKERSMRETGLTVRLLPVDSCAGVWGGGCEYNLAPGTMRVCRRRGRRRRGVVNGSQDRVYERV